MSGVDFYKRLDEVLTEVSRNTGRSKRAILENAVKEGDRREAIIRRRNSLHPENPSYFATLKGREFNGDDD